MLEHYNYDSVCTVIDTELYKLVAFEMLVEAGVQVFVNTRVVGAIVDGPRVRGAIVESRAGREAFYARSFVDCTAYGDLAALAGAKYTEPNDYPVCNSVGIGNVDIGYTRLPDRFWRKNIAASWRCCHHENNTYLRIMSSYQGMAWHQDLPPPAYCTSKTGGFRV
jgi:hypothetical protein